MVANHCNMDSRGSARRDAERQEAFDELAQNWFQRQGPYLGASLSRMHGNFQDAYSHNQFGYEEIEARPMARATNSTFVGPTVTSKPPCPFRNECIVCASSMGKCNVATTSTTSNLHQSNDLKIQQTIRPLIHRNDENLKSHPENFLRNDVTLSYSCQTEYNSSMDLFRKSLDLVFEGGYLHWYELMRLRRVSKGCWAIWHEKRDTAGPWNSILKELNALNGTNKCHCCEKAILLKNDKELCLRMSEAANNYQHSNSNGRKKRKIKNKVWDVVSATRTPDFVSCADILMSSGVLNWRERGGIRRICKATYKIHNNYCTCKNPIDRSNALPFLMIDPRYQVGYHEDWSDYERCVAMIRYTLVLKKNLHSFYNFHKVTDPDCLPYGLARWNWFDIQMNNLQSNCPKRYAFTMHLGSLFLAQEELQRFPPVWYADAFAGTRHRPYGDSFVQSLACTLSDNCLPATDEVLCNFLRTRCYPTSKTQTLLGPLSENLSMFSPFFCMVPLDENQKTDLPKCLEELDEELIDSMSVDLLCSIM